MNPARVLQQYLSEERRALIAELGSLFQERSLDSGVYARLLQSCAKLKALPEGKRVHDHIVRTGMPDRYVANNLLSMYAKCGDVAEARAVFDRIPNPNVVSWSCLIAAYAQNGHGRKSMELLRQMLLLRQGPQPNRVTFLNVLAGVRSLDDGKLVHQWASDCGLGDDVSVCNALLHMYGRCSSLELAKQLFDKMGRTRTVVTWNAMMGAYLHSSCSDSALHLFGRMELEEVQVNAVSVMLALNACSYLGALSEGRNIHARVAEQHPELAAGNTVVTALLNMYGKCGCLAQAKSIFDGMQTKDVIAWNALIGAYAHHGQSEEALLLFRDMSAGPVKPNSITFVSALGACCSQEFLKDGRQIHAQIVREGLEQEPVVRNALVSMYSRCGSIDEAEFMFRSSDTRDGGLWNVMIAAYVHCSRCSQAIECFYRMMQQADSSARPTNLTFVTVLNACTNLSEGKQIHGFAARAGFETDMVVGNAVLGMYTRCGSLEDTEAVFSRMVRRNVISWTTMLSAYARHSRCGDALSCFKLMLMDGVRPNALTLSAAVDAAAGTAAVDRDEGRFVHGLVNEAGFDRDHVVVNALVAMYGRRGNLSRAYGLFSRLERPSVVSWTALVSAYAQQGQGEQAMELFAAMQQEGVLPNVVTFLSIMFACSHSGQPEQGPVYFESMTLDYGLSPLWEHCVCLVDLCGRAGMLEAAEWVVRKMPFEPGMLPWMTLLSHCKSYGDIERGERAAAELLVIKPRHAPAYATLSNMYIAAVSRNSSNRMF